MGVGGGGGTQAAVCCKSDCRKRTQDGIKLSKTAEIGPKINDSGVKSGAFLLPLTPLTHRDATLFPMSGPDLNVIPEILDLIQRLGNPACFHECEVLNKQLVDYERTGASLASGGCRHTSCIWPTVRDATSCARTVGVWGPRRYAAAAGRT